VLFASVPKNRDGKPVLNPMGMSRAHGLRGCGYADTVLTCVLRLGAMLAAYLFGGDETAVDGTRPQGAVADPLAGPGSGLNTLRRNTIRGLIRGTFTRRGGLEAASSEQEQAEDQRFYLQQRRDASKFTMVRGECVSVYVCGRAYPDTTGRRVARVRQGPLPH
jgi:hypothetical protein